jgi:hypothetical protein
MARRADMEGPGCCKSMKRLLFSEGPEPWHPSPHPASQSDSDPIGPHDDNPPSRGKLERGGTPDSAPLNFDDDEIYSGRGKKRDGGTTHAAGGDSGKVGPPAEQLSDTNAPSDPANRKGSA